MNDPRYPIGKYESGPLRLEQWIDEIAAAPAQLREAVRGLSDEQLDTPLARGYDGAVAQKVNAPYVWLLLSLAFIAVSWAGHASWVVRIGGLAVLTDPVWSRRIIGTPARITPVGLAWSALPRRVTRTPANRCGG